VDGKEIKYSPAHLTVLDCAPPEMTYIARRAGYDYVSFRPVSLGTKDEPKHLLTSGISAPGVSNEG
jgi:hypothetical protein